MAACHGCFSPSLRLRICPGRHLAKDIIFLFVASVLHAFQVQPTVDDTGTPVKIQSEPTTGLFSYVLSFFVPLEAAYIKDAGTQTACPAS